MSVPTTDSRDMGTVPGGAGGPIVADDSDSIMWTLVVVITPLKCLLKNCDTLSLNKTAEYDLS